MSDLGELAVKLSMDTGSVSSQIKRLKSEMTSLDAGFQAAASQAGGFGSAMDAAAARANMLQGKLNAANGIVERQKRVWDDAKHSLEQAKAKYEETGRKLEENRSKAQELESEIARLEAAMRAEAAANGETSEAYQQMSEELERLKAAQAETAAEGQTLEQQFQRQGASVANLTNQVQRAETAYNQAQTAANRLSTEVDAATKRLKNHVDQLEAAGKKLTEFGEAADKAGQNQQKIGGAITTGLTMPIAAAGTAAVTAAVQWESAFAGVRKTVDGTEEQMAELEQELLTMEVPTSYKELADIAANAGQLGIARENVVSFTRTMADLAETTDLTADAAATAFAQYGNIVGLDPSNYDRLGSVVVDLGNNMATTESKIVDFATAISAAGNQAHMSDTEIFGIAAGLSSLGMEAQAGGTAFSKILTEMNVAVQTGSDDLKEFAKVAGMSAKDFAAAYKQDAAGAFMLFIEGLAKGGDQAVVMLDKMGITETRMRDMLLRATGATELMRSGIATANKAWDQNNALAKEAAVRYQTTESKMAMLGKQATQVGISFGESMLPSLQQGLDFVSTLIEGFAGLDEETRKTIVQWGLLAAGIGPAISLIGKLNSGIGAASSALGTFATSMAGAGGGLGGFASALGGLLGPAGIAVAGAAALAAGGYFLYMASGAKEAAEAIKAMNEQADSWQKTQAKTLYDTGSGDALAQFGLRKEDFGGGEAAQAGKDWLSELNAVWTDGKKETNEIVKGFVDSFTGASDGVREAIEGQQGLLEGYDALTPEAKATMEADLKQLDEWDQEVERLLKKRQNGMLTPEEQQRLQEIIDKRGEIEVKYKLDDTDSGYEKILGDMEATVERAQHGGQLDPAYMGNVMNALADGRKAYMDALDQSYNSEYRQIQAIEDETARQKALDELNARYQERRQEGEEAYAESVRVAGQEAWKQNGYDEQIDQMNKLAAMLGDTENMDVTAVQDMFAGMDEGKITSMLAMIEQMKAAGVSDDQLKEMGINYDDILETVTQIRNISQDTEGLEGIAKAFGEALPEELQRVLVGLDMTQAAEDWAAFAEGGNLPKIKAGAEVTSLQGEDGKEYKLENCQVTATLGKVTGDGKTIEVESAEVTADGKLKSVTGKDGKTYTVTSATVEAKGTLKSVDGKGKTFSVTGATVNADGKLTSVTGENGKIYQVTGATVEAKGTLKSVDGKGKTFSVTGATVTADGTLYTVTGEDGKSYTVSDAEIGADAKLYTVTGKDGTSYTVSDAEIGADAKLYTVTGKDGTSYTVSDADVKVEGSLGTVVGEDGKIYKVTSAIVKADGTLASVVAEDGKVYTVDGANVQVNDALVKVRLSNLDQTQIDNWNKANQDPGFKVSPVRLGLKYPDWEGEVQKAIDEGRAKLYDPKGMQIEMTPEAASQIGKNDLVMGVDDDGTIHIQIVAEPGQEKVDLSKEVMDDKGPIPLLGSSLQDQVDLIAAYNANIREYNKLKQEAMESGDTGLADMYGQLADSTGLNMTKELQSLSDTDLSAIGEHIGVLTEAIESGNGTAEEIAAWKEELQGLQDFIAAIPEGLTNETGTDISEGIGEGMKNYGFDADAQTVAGYIDTALRTKIGANSPATLTIPIGKDVSEGIGKGMLEYSFTEAAQVAKDIVDAFDGLDGDGNDIGKDFAKGLARGITNGSSQVIEAAKKTAEAAIRAAKEKLEISSPSKVGAELGGFYTAGIAKGISDGQKELASATRRALEPLMDGPMSMRLNDAGYLDGRGDRATLRALDALAGDVRRAGYAAAAQPPLDVEALADANARRPVVLQVGARQLARTSAEATYDAQNEYQRKVAFAYGGNK